MHRPILIESFARLIPRIEVRSAEWRSNSACVSEVVPAADAHVSMRLPVWSKSAIPESKVVSSGVMERRVTQPTGRP